MLLETRKTQVLEKIAALTVQAERLYNISLPRIDVRFDLTGRVAGYAGWRMTNGTINYFMRFNTDMMLSSWDHIINETAPHETAHIVCQSHSYLGSKHDQGWRRVCIALGGSGQRCHNELVIYAKGNTYQYTTTTGATVNVSGKIHNNVCAGRTYTYKDRHQGSIDASCQYQLIAVSGRRISDDTPNAVNPKVTVKTTVVQSNGSGTKADQVRYLIKQAKINSYDQNYVIGQVIAVLGMSRSLARTYVQGNWHKV
jgi:predicted SprT family Zn-dependent metalloprotease